MSKNHQRFNQISQNAVTQSQETKETTSVTESQQTEEVVKTLVESSSPAVVTPTATTTPIAIKSLAPQPQQTNTMTQPAAKLHPAQTELMNMGLALSMSKPVEGRWQYNLFQFLKNIIEKETGENFDRSWNAVLMHFQRSQNTLFSETHILRMGDNWPGSENDFSLYRRLIHVIVETCTPEKRQAVASRIDMNRALVGLSEEGRNRLISYYA